jgi:hypothetical protein
MAAEVEETVGDCAYGGGPTRRAFAEEDRVLTAKVPACSNGDCFPKSEFAIDVEGDGGTTGVDLGHPIGRVWKAYSSVM